MKIVRTDSVKVLGFEELKKDYIDDINYFVADQKEQIKEYANELNNNFNEETVTKINNNSKSITAWLKIIDEISALKENREGFDYLKAYAESRGFAHEIELFDNIIEIDDKKIGIGEFYEPGTYPEEFRAKNYVVENLNENNHYIYQFVDFFEKDKGAKWSKMYDNRGLESEWTNVDDSIFDKTVCKEILKIDNRKLFEELEPIGNELLKDDGIKIIETIQDDTFSAKSYCGDILSTIFYIAIDNENYLDDEMISGLIENEVKPIMQIVNKLQDNKEFSLNDLMVLNDIDSINGAGIYAYKGTDFETLRDVKKTEIFKADENTVFKTNESTRSLDQLDKLEALIKESKETISEMEKLVNKVKVGGGRE